MKFFLDGLLRLFDLGFHVLSVIPSGQLLLVEIFGGLAVILGAFVSLASLPMAAVLFVAMITVHLPYGFSSIKIMSVTNGRAQFGPPGYETDLLYIACIAALVLGGSGPFSIDGYIKNRKNSGRK